MLLGIIGLALGFVVSGGWNGLFGTHRNLGVAATVLGLAQVGGTVVLCEAAMLRRVAAQRGVRATDLWMGLGAWRALQNAWLTHHRPPAAQIPALRWRPAPSSPRRRLWNVSHWWIGRAAVLVAVANIF